MGLGDPARHPVNAGRTQMFQEKSWTLQYRSSRPDASSDGLTAVPVDRRPEPLGRGRELTGVPRASTAMEAVCATRCATRSWPAALHTVSAKSGLRLPANGSAKLSRYIGKVENIGYSDSGIRANRAYP